MKKPLRRRIFNIWTISAAVIIILILLYLHSRSRAAPAFQTASAQIGDVVEMVSVIGTVSPVDSAGLAFETSGVISQVYVSVGQMVKAGDKIASLDGVEDQANLESAQAKLADMTRSLTPTELSDQQAKVAAAQVTLENAEQDALTAAQTGYVDAQSAISNYADILFTNPQSANPTLDIQAQSSIQQNALDSGRVSVGTTLGEWQSGITSATSTLVAASLISRAAGYISSIQMFVNALSSLVASLTPSNAGSSQASINADVSAVNSALADLSQAATSVSGAQTELQSASSGSDQAQSDYDLALAGSSAQSIQAQAASVAALQAQLDKDTIVSPINGIVTQADPTVGEFMAAGQSGFAVESNGQFKVEAYVPEADIAKVAIGDLASTTLNAYGSYVDFPTQVVAIDPAETVLEGVPTYKVTLDFVTPDPRILSGMTANLEILTHRADDVLEIPYRAVTITATSSTVRLVSADGRSYSTVPVSTGLKGSDGSIEIDSGLNVGDKVVTYVPGQA